jgi:hypothetical protein
LIYDYSPVEIVEDKESGKPETGTPEWIRNPGVKVIEVWRRIVVCDHRRSLIIVITVYTLRIRIILGTRGFGAVGTGARIRTYRQAGCNGNGIEPL